MEPRPVLAITHMPMGHFGLVGEALGRRGVPLVGADPEDGGLPSDLARFSAIVSFGGHASAVDARPSSGLAAEIALLASALRDEVPVLGLCLGGQLLSAAAGGDVRRLEHRYVGWTPLAPTPAAAEDPLLSVLGAPVPVLEWHLDAIELPPDGESLAETDGPGRSVFRTGPAAWGSQLHLELTPDTLDAWLGSREHHAELASAGVDGEAIARGAATHLAAQVAFGRALFERFAELVARREH
jgi:GMP synthase (glutamine-hydrolysing)